MALTTAAVAAATMKIEPAESPIQADSDNALISRSTRLVSESSTMTVRYSRRWPMRMAYGLWPEADTHKPGIRGVSWENLGSAPCSEAL